MSSQLRLGLPEGLFPVDLRVKILKALLPSSIMASRPGHFNLLDYILGERFKTMKFLIAEHSSLPIIIPLLSKYSPHDPVYKYP